MTKEKIAYFKAKLEDEKTRLLHELQDFGSKDINSGHYDPKFEESGNSEDDNAEEITEFTNDASIENRLESELKDTEAALVSIEKGIYGTCKYCDKPIDEKRLEARPSSSSCITCKKVLTQEM